MIPKALKETLRVSKNQTIFLTGAGISVDSGIKTFRGGHESIWDVTNEEMATTAYFNKNPLTHWQWHNSIVPIDAKPNIGHEAIASTGIPVITQNIDGLHGPDAIEIHGNAFKMKCTKCGAKEEIRPFERNIVSKGTVPPCNVFECNGIMRPDVLWFDELYSKEICDKVEELIVGKSILIVVGTTLKTNMASQIYGHFVRRGLITVFIDPVNSFTARQASFFLHGNSSDKLPEICEALNET